MINVRSAPAGYIASLYRDDAQIIKSDHPDGGEYPDPLAYLGATGKWKPTATEAVRSLLERVEHKRKLLRARAARLQATITELDGASLVARRD